MGPTARSSITLLAEDPAGLGLRLPAGRIVADRSGTPAMWLSDGAPSRDLLHEAHARAARTHLWPVVLTMEGFDIPLEPGWPPAPVEARPLLDERSAIASRMDAHDPLTCDACEAMIDFYRSRPGAQLAEESDQDPGRVAAEVAVLRLPHSSPRLGLVAGDRSADIPTALGWVGPMNDRIDIAWYSAVLGEWEERFGSRVAVIDGAGLMCAVGSPPRTFDEAYRLAVEQLAFCPDLAGEFDSVKGHAASLMDVSAWSFYWD